MDTSIVKSYELAEHESLANLCAITADLAVGLIHDFQSGQYLFAKFDANGITKVPICDEVLALRVYKTHLQNLSFGVVLFRAGTGIGLLIKDSIYFFDTSLRLERTFQIANDFPPDKHHRYFKPKRVFPLTDSLFGVSFNYCSCSPSYFSLLKFEGDTACYLQHATTLPEELYFQSDQHVLPPIVIMSIGGTDDELLFHTIGPDQNWYRYGMEFSMLCRLSVSRGKITKMCDVEKGFGCFSSDKRWLIVHQLRKNDTLHVYNTIGEYKAGIILKTKKNLGHLGKSYLWADIIEKSLWLHNASGVVLSDFSGDDI
jgi:hypothetical protein